MFFMIIVCLHWSWILGIVKGMEAEPISLSSLSYGQVSLILYELAYFPYQSQSGLVTLLNFTSLKGGIGAY